MGDAFATVPLYGYYFTVICTSYLREGKQGKGKGRMATSFFLLVSPIKQPSAWAGCFCVVPSSTSSFNLHREKNSKMRASAYKRVRRKCMGHLAVCTCCMTLLWPGAGSAHITVRSTPLTLREDAALYGDSSSKLPLFVGGWDGWVDG